jgi:hypothetical protein
MKSLVGYHYTTLEAWQNIQKVGLLPHILDGAQTQVIRDWTGLKKPKGIWLWQKRLRGSSHVGTLLHRAIDHAKGELPIIALLRIELTPDMIQCWGSKNSDIRVGTNVTHTGTFNDWKYHTEEDVWIVKNKIEPKSITLVKTYDITRKLQ